LPNLDGLPAVQELPLSSQHLMAAFGGYNRGKPYYSQVKPFSLFMTSRIDEFGHRDELQGRRHLVKPYDPSPKGWKDTPWINLATGERHWVATGFAQPAISSRIMKKDDKSSHVMAYGDVVMKHKYRAETRYCDSKGVICNPKTAGKLYRMAISIGGIHYIGKETNELQRVFLGMARPDEVYAFYEHDWTDEIRDKLRLIPRGELIECIKEKGSGLSKSQINKILSGKHKPNPKDRKIIINITREWQDDSVSQLAKLRAANARKMCESLKVTQSDLARMASVSRPTVIAFLRGEPVRWSTLRRIESALDKLTRQNRRGEEKAPKWSPQVGSSTDELSELRRIVNSISGSAP
jgi:predicted transcriptional regulator